MTSALAPAVRWAGPYLSVDKAPFLVVGAEVHNSSSSSPAVITESFETVHQLGANSVLAPVAWDLLEPTEGVFDFDLIDTMIATARGLGLKLIPLWFGSWKNAVSTYVPGWVKTDPRRFPRSERSDGTPVEHLTPFVTASRDADARAFAALMARIREVDVDHTVVAVQVHNEVGILGASRDHSRHADAAYASLVPASVIDAVARDVDAPAYRAWVSAGSPKAGSWAEVFGPGERTDEAFMAAGFAAYTGSVAAAGAAEHDVPVFVNAWLDADSVLDGPVAVAGGKRPGDYPSGGPVLPVAAIWEALAPALDFLAVDAYVDDADPVFAAYRARRNRLFIPELRADARGIEQMFSAVGAHRALGVSPFGVDSLDPEDPDTAPLRDAYRLLRVVGHLIRRHPDAEIRGFTLDGAVPHVEIRLGDVDVQVHALDGRPPQDRPVPGYGIAVDIGDGSLFIIGRGLRVSLAAAAGRQVGFLTATDYDLADDELTVSRQLNGDETAGGTALFMPFVDTPLLPSRVIPTRLPDTGIVRIRAYTY
ncbi:DUF5597 domain-containing protein [Microbacterium sp. EYE_5]|uniref:DUF5597 domain-containing protein n=1 Tax=unclassified Microbacterium TaxID=2609290 RepID=UPI0020063BC6|nr:MULTISPECIES: DUF5597 domain-containing protein [unclassified Microbacterium]MCK6079402.1 DUF5597 domain-containing protein [Microbacterium sp. EYE_382]MCK6084672.1 DUF5597 domain-containing protein [Microbacterium sp. EYE_384]MCK6123099.1 DUF5597 domain-containing protein [Microbacterium sp. EYE_80]MCK6125436.1 DUF5597 domain-containing protein [Microbacterium sp. EYE_79]MCK6140356.1 DUF5597 domain-containing protein [Microbacterium sp. EYE_39]